MENPTVNLNTHSIETIRRQIDKKNSIHPYFANQKTVLNSVTDYDHFPYNRWFRGVYYYPEPIVAEREAGYRPIEQNCYNLVFPPQKTPNYIGCFEPACSTIFPCLSKENSDREDKNRAIDAMCIMKYR